MNSSESGVSADLANANVNRAATLVGSSMAIFTFILFFLYPRYSTNQIDPILFQATLTLIVLTVFAFGLSGFYYYGLVGVANMTSSKRQVYSRRGNLLFVVGLAIATFEPAMILFTVGLVAVALIATFLWLLYAVLVLFQGRELSYR